MRGGAFLATVTMMVVVLAVPGTAGAAPVPSWDDVRTDTCGVGSIDTYGPGPGGGVTISGTITACGPLVASTRWAIVGYTNTMGLAVRVLPYAYGGATAFTIDFSAAEATFAKALCLADRPNHNLSCLSVTASGTAPPLVAPTAVTDPQVRLTFFPGHTHTGDPNCGTCI